MEKLVESLGINRPSESQVSVMAAELDERVESFRTRPLDVGPFTFVAADALMLKVREGGRVVNVHALVATGLNADGHRGPWPCRSPPPRTARVGVSPRVQWRLGTELGPRQGGPAAGVPSSQRVQPVGAYDQPTYGAPA